MCRVLFGTFLGARSGKLGPVSADFQWEGADSDAWYDGFGNLIQLSVHFNINRTCSGIHMHLLCCTYLLSYVCKVSL